MARQLEDAQLSVIVRVFLAFLLKAVAVAVGPEIQMTAALLQTNFPLYYFKIQRPEAPRGVGRVANQAIAMGKRQEEIALL